MVSNEVAGDEVRPDDGPELDVESQDVVQVRPDDLKLFIWVVLAKLQVAKRTTPTGGDPDEHSQSCP